MEIFENTATRKSDSAGHFIKKVGWQLLRRAATSGTMGGLAAAMAASIAGKYENDSFAAPLNATSHIIWGDEAARQDRFSLKYTLTGFLLNHVSAISWALFYEKLFGKHTAKRQQATPSVSKPNDALMIKCISLDLIGQTMSDSNCRQCQQRPSSVGNNNPEGRVCPFVARHQTLLKQSCCGAR